MNRLLLVQPLERRYLLSAVLVDGTLQVVGGTEMT